MAPSPITEDYYMILEVEQTASPQLINSAYRRLALNLHPDRNRSPNATEAFQIVCQFSQPKPTLWSIILLSVLK
jgi:curved DNA-binding protein CbpA